MWAIALKLVRWLGPYAVAAMVAASAAWWQTDTYWRGEYAALERDYALSLVEAQGVALAAKEKSEAELADAETRAATVARTLAAERSKAATDLHTTIGAVDDPDLRACLAMPLGRLLDSLPR